MIKRIILLMLVMFMGCQSDNLTSINSSYELNREVTETPTPTVRDFICGATTSPPRGGGADRDPAPSAPAPTSTAAAANTVAAAGYAGGHIPASVGDTVSWGGQGMGFASGYGGTVSSTGTTSSYFDAATTINASAQRQAELIAQNQSQLDEYKQTYVDSRPSVTQPRDPHIMESFWQEVTAKETAAVLGTDTGGVRSDIWGTADVQPQSVSEAQIQILLADMHINTANEDIRSIREEISSLQVTLDNERMRLVNEKDKGYASFSEGRLMSDSPLYSETKFRLNQLKKEIGERESYKAQEEAKKAKYQGQTLTEQASEALQGIKYDTNIMESPPASPPAEAGTMEYVDKTPKIEDVIQKQKRPLAEGTADKPWTPAEVFEGLKMPDKPPDYLSAFADEGDMSMNPSITPPSDVIPEGLSVVDGQTVFKLPADVAEMDRAELKTAFETGDITQREFIEGNWS